MEDDAALQARIDALTGQIEERKQVFAQPHAHHASPHFQSTRGSHRWNPYGRGGRANFPKAHKNRTLIIAGAQNGTMTSPSSPHVAPSSAQPEFISTRGAKVNQLMTKDTFEREQKHRQEFKETQRETKRPKPDHRSSGDLPQVAKPVMQPRELVIDGIRFQLKDDGSKLIRIHDLANAGEDTPRKAKVADVEFLRTKNGNLVRVTSQHGDHRSAKRTKKAQCENFTKYGTRSPILIYAGGARATTCEVPIARWTSVSRVQWILTCSTGTCSFGPSCKFAHNPTKVAICKELMRNGSCHSRKTCDMSHELTYHRVPACTHFLRGNCTNSACRYPHVYVSPTARVCRAFATLGFCAKGPDCDDRHVFECPDYANHGHCAALEKGSCSLQHIDRAGALRKAEKRQGKIDPQDDSDMTSDEEEEEQDEQEDGHKQAAYDSESDVDTDIELGSSGFEQQDFMALS